MRQKVGLVLLVGGTLSVTSRLFVRLPFWESLSHETSRAALLLSTQPQAPQHITAGKSPFIGLKRALTYQSSYLIRFGVRAWTT